jgi:histidine ammonia-lyase
VSFRILPRVLGAARRALGAAEAAAATALRSVTDNPVYIPPDDRRPLGEVFSTGGYHNASATPAMDALAAQLADLCQLAERHADHLFQHPSTAPLLSAEEWSIKPVHMAQNWWAEEARSRAGTTLLSLGGFGQNDIAGLPFLAWHRATEVGRCLDGALASLAAICSQGFHAAGRSAGPALDPLLARVREAFPPLAAARDVRGDFQALLEAFAARAS